MSDAERFPFRRIAAGAYLPMVLFALGEGALIPYLPLIAGDLGATLTVAGLVVAVMTIGEFAGSVPGGLLVARFGEQRVMVGASLVTILALAGAWFATEVWMLALAILVMGLSKAVIALARHAFLTVWVPYRYRARALSALGGTYRLGLFVGPFVASACIASGAAPAVSLLLFAGACAAAILVLLLLPDPEEQMVASRAAPGGSEPGRPTTAGSQAGLGTTLRRYGRVLGTVGVGAAVLAFARRARDVIVPLWAVSIGVDDATIGIIVGIAGAVDFGLFFVSGFVMDRFGRLWAVVPSLVLMGVGFTVLAATHDGASAFAGLMIGTGLLAIANGASAGILLTLGADLADPHNPAPFLGAWRLMTNSGAALAPLAIAGGIAAASIVATGFGLLVACLVGAGVLWRTIPRVAPPPDAPSS